MQIEAYGRVSISKEKSVDGEADNDGPQKKGENQLVGAEFFHTVIAACLIKKTQEFTPERRETK
jgi:hypothetical protein